MRQTVRRSGFTLVEVLIALALTGIVALLMLEGMRFAVAGLARVSDRAERLDTRQSIDALLRRALGSTLAAPLRPGVPGFVGGPESVRALTLAEDSGAGLYRVTLAVATSGGHQQLVFTRRRFGALGALETERTVLVRRLRHLRIDYFGSAQPDEPPRWHARWDGSRAPPLLVRVAIDTGDGEARPPLIVRLWAASL